MQGLENEHCEGKENKFKGLNCYGLNIFGLRTQLIVTQKSFCSYSPSATIPPLKGAQQTQLEFPLSSSDSKMNYFTFDINNNTQWIQKIPPL